MLIAYTRRGHLIRGTAKLDPNLLVCDPRLDGSISPGEISFTTGSESSPYGRIDWHGYFNGVTLKGTYRSVGGSEQTGVFELKRL